MGYFLHFSDEHSSLVAIVKNMETSYVSSQYHDIFNDIFQTVFSTGKNYMMVDAICN